MGHGAKIASAPGSYVVRLVILYRHRFTSFALALLTSLWMGCAADDPGRVPPNILLIVADDLGIHDLAATGNPDVSSPNLDRLAAEGMRFTRFYSAGDVCSPTRASLLTGLYPQRLGYRTHARGVPEDVTTLPELLREEGYTTHYVGKWHLGDSLPSVRPRRQGYDSFFGFLDQKRLAPAAADGGVTLPGYLDPLLVAHDGAPRPHKGHLTDLLSEAAVRRIHRSARTAPWLLQVSYLAPHAPIEPPARWAQRHPDTPRGRYHALLAALDEGVGHLLAALEETGQAERTVVVFLSDNGATEIDAPSNEPILGRKTQFYEGALRVPLIVRVPGLRGGVRVDAVASSLDLYPTLAALAGVDLTQPVDGRDLGPILRGDGEVPEKALFWEYETFGGPWTVDVAPTPRRRAGEDLLRGVDFGVLSADGRWRLAKELHDVALFDLASDPTAHSNVYAKHPQRVAELLGLYRRWSRAVREIPVDLEAEDGARWDASAAALSAGRLRLTGRDVIRTPGFGGWTFAVGVQPADDAASETSTRAQILAGQDGVWSLSRNPDGELVAQLGDATLRTPGPEAGDCAALVLTTLSFPPDLPSLLPLGRRSNRSRGDLYVDGELRHAMALVWTPPDDALRRATVVGGGGFVGILRHPTLQSARLAPPDVAELSATLCDPGAGEVSAP